MKIKSVSLLVFFSFVVQPLAYSQVVPCIPESRRVSWQNAGLYEEPNSIADNVINTNCYSGTDYDKIVAAINDANLLPGMTIIYFPPGTYTIGNTINISNVKDSGIIFQGAGADETLLKFDGVDKNSHCFNIYGQYTGSQKSIDQNINKGDQWIYTNDGTSGIVVGDWIHFREPGFNDDYPGEDSWNGQISQVCEINTYDLKIKDEASKSYVASNDMWIREMDPAYNIGFENFKIERTNTAKGYGVTFKFDKAVNCWIKGVESYKCTGYHVNASTSSHLEISGCYFHVATNYDSDEGTGYGVVLARSTTNCLIENNIFRKTRHAMLVGTGVNCNVFTYNYSREQEWDWSFLYPGADICIHGRYPYANLFEHNTIDFIMADPSHGDNGPYNTFFRNRYPSKVNICIFNSSYTNVIGNLKVSEVTTDPSWLIEIGYDIWDILGGPSYDPKESTHTFDRYFNYYPEGPDWDWGWTSITHGLWWSFYQPDGFYFSVMFPRSFLNDVSYYYDGRPDFVSSQYYTWPSHGPSTNIERDNVIEATSWNIPAEDRWEESVRTYINPTDWPDKTYVSGQFNRDIKLPGSLVHDVQVIGDLVVLSGATLTIEPGINLLFNDNTGLTINGALDAQGTSSEPIVFTSANPNPSPSSQSPPNVDTFMKIKKDHQTLTLGVPPPWGRFNLNLAQQTLTLSDIYRQRV